MFKQYSKKNKNIFHNIYFATLSKIMFIILQMNKVYHRKLVSLRRFKIPANCLNIHPPSPNKKKSIAKEHTDEISYIKNRQHNV